MMHAEVKMHNKLESDVTLEHEKSEVFAFVVHTLPHSIELLSSGSIDVCSRNKAQFFN
jgi:hypothetical protein